MMGADGNDERESVTKQKVAPRDGEQNAAQGEQPKAQPATDRFEEETETGKLTGVGAW